MLKSDNAFNTEIMPFNNFHKKSIIKDIPTLYLLKSKYNDLIYISYMSDRNGDCNLELRDKNMYKIEGMQSRQTAEKIIFIDETEEFLFCVAEHHTDGIKIFKYEKHEEYGLGSRKILTYENQQLIIKNAYSKLFTSNDTHLILLIGNVLYIVNKLNDECTIYDDTIYIAHKCKEDNKNCNVITKDGEFLITQGQSFTEPLFINITDDNKIVVCYKKSNFEIDRDTLIRKTKHDYYVSIFDYTDDGFIGNTCKIEDGYIPTCISIFDSLVVFGLRNENKNIGVEQNRQMLLLVDIKELLDTNKKDLYVDFYKQYSTKFKNSNFTKVTRDNTYIYAGSENGDITIFSINDFYDVSNNYRIITKEANDFILVGANDYLSYIPGSNINLTYMGNSSFFINNACNGKLEFMYVDNYYLYVASKNNHDITVYIRDVKPIIVDGSDKVYTYMDGTDYIINYSAVIDHDDRMIYTRYRISLINGDKNIVVKDWSSYNDTEDERYRYKIKERIKINTKELNYYNCKLLVEVEDVNKVLVSAEYELDMLLDKECRLYSNKIIIPYKTIPDKDLILKYSFYTLNGNILEEVDKGQFNVLSSYNTEWEVSIYEQETYIQNGTGVEKILTPHVNTKPVSTHNFDYIEIGRPNIDNDVNKILYLTYMFESEGENWSKRYPDNGEYYIYDLSDFYKPKSIAKADGGISNVDKFNILDLSYGPGMETVNSLIFKADSGNKYEMKVTNTGHIELVKVNTSSQNIIDNINLCFRVRDNDRYDLGIKAPDGQIWDFDIISNSNGRRKHKYLIPLHVGDKEDLEGLYGRRYKLRDSDSSEERILTESDADYLTNNGGKTIYLYSSSAYTVDTKMEYENLFIYKKNYDIDSIENIVKALSNPIKSVIIEKEDIEKYRLTDKYDKYGNPTNNDNKIGYTMHLEGLAEETFKDHNHYFNVYSGGLKLPYKLIESDTDRRGEYSVRFIYDTRGREDEDPSEYKDETIEIELMHSDNIDSETVIHKVKIQNEKDIEDLYNGDFHVYIPEIQKSIDLKEFKLFIEYPLVNSTYRIDNCNYIIRRDKENPSKLYIKLRNYILNNIGCTIVLTTVDVNKQLTYYLENNQDENARPYYYVPLMKYDEYGNLMYFYSDNIKSFDVVVDGYTLMPYMDYTLVNYYLHSHMPSFILFNEILKPDTHVEIIFNNEEVSDIISISDNDSDRIIVEDGYNMFIDGCFSIFVEGKKLRKDQYIIENPHQLRLLVTSYKRVYVKFQYKGYENLSSLIEILYARKTENVDTGKNKYPEYTYNDYFTEIGFEDIKKEGKLYLIEAHSDKCFKDKKDAIFNCNYIDDKMFDVHIDCGLKYNLSYINNDIIIDSNECYDRNDFTMTNMPTDNIIIEPEKPNTPPVFIEQPIVKDFNKEEIMISFRVKDAESIFFNYEMSINGGSYAPINDYTVTGNKVFVYIKGLSTTRDHTVSFLVSDGELTTESDIVELNFTANNSVALPVFRQQPKLISSPNRLSAEFSIDAYEPNGKPMYLLIYINGKEYNLGTFNNAVSGGKIICDKFETYGDYIVSFKLVNMLDTTIFKNSRDMLVRLVENKNPEITSFIIDSENHNEKYIISHVLIKDIDSDIDSMRIKVFMDGLQLYSNYEYKIVNDIIYVFVDNIKPGNHDIYLKILDDFDNSVETETRSFEIFDLLTPIEDIGHNKGIHNLQLDKFGNISFEYRVKDQNNMSLKHEISYNGFKFIEIDPVCYDDTYVFIGNIGTKLKEIKNLKVKITNNMGKYIILEYPVSVFLPSNDPIAFNGNPYITVLNESRIEVEYTPTNYDNDLLYAYYSFDDHPWIRVYPGLKNNVGTYSFILDDIFKGEHKIRLKITDSITTAISEYIKFEL